MKSPIAAPIIILAASRFAFAAVILAFALVVCL